MLAGLMLLHVGLAIAFDPGVKTVAGNTESLGDLCHWVMALSHLLDGGQFEFFRVTLLLAHNTS
ncbi:hypothetical protein D3C78_1648890 [compost metagenome]